jgi:prepilin-type processing-associated H-X9-DG protein
MRSSNFKLNTLYLDGHKSYVAELAVRTDSELFDKIVIMEGGGDLVDERFHNQSSLMSLASLAAISA